MELMRGKVGYFADVFRRGRGAVAALAMGMVGIVACDAERKEAGSAKPGPREVRVAVAASMVPLVEAAGQELVAAQGSRVLISSGASGVLAQQIRQGAPFDLFVSADLKRVRELEQQGFIEPGGVRVYAIGILALARRGSGRQLEQPIELLKGLPESTRLAIPDPERAPYGTAALEALETAGMSASTASIRFTAESAGQARQYLMAGNVDYAFLPLSLVDRERMDWVVIPDHMHTPIDQALGIVKGAANRAEARALAEELAGPHGHQRLRDGGYRVPGS